MCVCVCGGGGGVRGRSRIPALFQFCAFACGSYRVRKHTYLGAEKQKHTCVSFMVADGTCGLFVIGVLPQAFLFPDFVNALRGTCGACNSTLSASDDSQAAKTKAGTSQAARTRLGCYSGLEGATELMNRLCFDELWLMFTCTMRTSLQGTS